MDPLGKFVTDIKRRLTPERAEHIACFAPQLRELGRSRFLADYLRKHLHDRDFQRNNRYSDLVILLAHEDGPWGRFQVRVVEWPTDPNYAIYHADFAHTHTFSLLTYGYSGPGYFTDIVTCDPEELKQAKLGSPVTVGRIRRRQLKKGTILHFPAFRVAHWQHPAPKYSLSLNLIVVPPNPNRYHQYRIADGRLVGKARSISRQQ